MKKIILLSCILILLPLSVLASTINVPGDQLTIQAGINAAVDGDVVLLAPVLEIIMLILVVSLLSGCEAAVDNHNK